MEFLFGKRKTPEQMMRENQRALNKTIRELEREKARLENEEKIVVIDIKNMAKQGQMDAVKIMAKDLVRTRNYVKKFILMKANIQVIYNNYYTSFSHYLITYYLTSHLVCYFRILFILHGI